MWRATKTILEIRCLSCVIPDELKKYEAPLTEDYVIDGPVFVKIKKALQKIKSYGEHYDFQIAAALLTRLEELHVKIVSWRWKTKQFMTND